MQMHRLLQENWRMPVWSQPSGDRAGYGSDSCSDSGILSTTRGYVIQQDSSCVREFKVRHESDQTAEEMNLIVDCGGRICNISISHRVYGRVSAEMDIRSRQDVNEFITALNNSNSSALSNATSGYHYHLVEAASEERLDLIEEQLKKQDSWHRFSHGSQNTKQEGNEEMTIAEIQQEILRMKKKNRMYVFWLMLIKVRKFWK